MELSMCRPKIHEQRHDEAVERDVHVDRVTDGQDHAEPIGRIQERRLKGAEIWSSGKEVGIPQHEVALWSVYAEAVPMQEEPGDIVTAT